MTLTEKNKNKKEEDRQERTYSNIRPSLVITVSWFFSIPWTLKDKEEIRQRSRRFTLLISLGKIQFFTLNETRDTYRYMHKQHFTHRHALMERRAAPLPWAIGGFVPCLNAFRYCPRHYADICPAPPISDFWDCNQQPSAYQAKSQWTESLLPPLKGV